MVLTSSSNKIFFQVILPSEDIQLGACAAILKTPLAHWQDIFFSPKYLLYNAGINFFLRPISKFQFNFIIKFQNFTVFEVLDF